MYYQLWQGNACVVDMDTAGDPTPEMFIEHVAHWLERNPRKDYRISICDPAGVGIKPLGEISAMEFFNMARDGKGMPLIELAKFCLRRLEAAENDGLEIDDGNIVDLIAYNSDASLADIRCALIVAGLAHRFPRATSPVMDRVAGALNHIGRVNIAARR